MIKYGLLNEVVITIQYNNKYTTLSKKFGWLIIGKLYNCYTFTKQLLWNYYDQNHSWDNYLHYLQ